MPCVYVHGNNGGGRVVDASEVLIFRDYTGWEEPALSTPFGFWSLRGIAVLGVFGMLAAALYWSIVPDDLDIQRDWLSVCISLSPLGIGAILGSVKPPVGTADSLLIALVVLACRSLSAGGTGGARRGAAGGKSAYRKRKRSQVLGFPRQLPPPRGAVSADERPLEVTCTDLDEPKSIRMTIHGGDGTRYGNRLVSCYIDDELLDVLRTAPDGSAVLNVRPEREGARRLIIREYVSDDESTGPDAVTGDAPAGAVLLNRPLHFMRVGGGGGAASAAGGSG